MLEQAYCDVPSPRNGIMEDEEDCGIVKLVQLDNLHFPFAEPGTVSFLHHAKCLETVQENFRQFFQGFSHLKQLHFEVTKSMTPWMLLSQFRCNLLI